jgi:transcriptional regulator with XRE-family HTH domain
MTESLLKAWLAKHGHTQQDLAYASGLTLSFLNNILNGKNTLIRVDTLLKLAEVTGIPCDKLCRNLVKMAKERRDPQ